jgi:hypothetical protein
MLISLLLPLLGDFGRFQKKLISGKNKRSRESEIHYINEIRGNRPNRPCVSHSLKTDSCLFVGGPLFVRSAPFCGQPNPRSSVFIRGQSFFVNFVPFRGQPHSRLLAFISGSVFQCLESLRSLRSFAVNPSPFRVFGVFRG